MNSILFIISITTTALIGFFAVSVTERNKQIFSLPEKFALSFPLGAGIIAFYLFYISILGFNITIISTVPLFMLGMFGILKLYTIRQSSNNLFFSPQRRRGAEKRPTDSMSLTPRLRVSAVNFYFLRMNQLRTRLDSFVNYEECWNKHSWIKRALLILFTITIVWKLSFMFFNAIVIPPIFDDAITCWSYKAKVIYFNKSIEMNPDNPLFLGGAYSLYPLAPSLFRVWIALIMGGWHEGYIQLHSLIILVSLLLLIFINLKEYTSFFMRVLSCYLIISVPLFSTHAYAGYADIILSCYITICFILLMKWYFTKENNILIIAAASMAMAIFTKNEGLVLYLPAALITFSYYCYKVAMKLDEKVKAVSLYILTLCIVAGPWIVFKIVYNIPLW